MSRSEIYDILKPADIQGNRERHIDTSEVEPARDAGTTESDSLTRTGTILLS